MADAEIHYKLDLIVRLVDTTTGKAIGQRQVTFQNEEQVIPFLRRDEGLYILLNRGRNDIELAHPGDGISARKGADLLRRTF